MTELMLTGCRRPSMCVRTRVTQRNSQYLATSDDINSSTNEPRQNNSYDANITWAVHWRDND